MAGRGKYILYILNILKMNLRYFIILAELVKLGSEDVLKITKYTLIDSGYLLIH
jgi:hypothetical protein